MLQQGFQSALDDLRAADIADAVGVVSGEGPSVDERQTQDHGWSVADTAVNQGPRYSNAQGDGEIQAADEQPYGSPHEAYILQTPQGPSAAAAAGRRSDLGTAGTSPVAAALGFWDLLGLGYGGSLLSSAAAAVAAHPGEAGGLSGYTRLVLRLDRVLIAGEGSAGKAASSAVALFEVSAEPFQFEVSWQENHCTCNALAGV